MMDRNNKNLVHAGEACFVHLESREVIGVGKRIVQCVVILNAVKDLSERFFTTYASFRMTTLLHVTL